MKKYEISNTSSGVVFGIYEGKTPEQALDAMARDAGYADHKAACEVASGDDVMAVEVTTLTLEAFDMTEDFMAEMKQAGITVKEINAPWEVEFTAPREVLESMLRTHWDMDDEEIADAFNEQA